MSSAGSWIELTAASLAVPLLALVPGGLFAARLWSLEPEERTAVAGGLGTGLLGAAAFVAHLAGGRPVCPLCGLAMDPAGHACVRSNGHSSLPIPEPDSGDDESEP